MRLAPSNGLRYGPRMATPGAYRHGDRRSIRRPDNARAITALIALFALLLGSLLPTLAFALSATEGATTALICTGQGLVRIDLATGEPVEPAGGADLGVDLGPAPGHCILCLAPGVAAPGSPAALTAQAIRYPALALPHPDMAPRLGPAADTALPAPPRAPPGRG
ncbi:hypothetical protein [Oceanibacterium hippocampi]|uniref:DUF2946 domain-containing protein n=1 Tax=Oceanibacterium hippocampi TaxID=745714 RepID=A0A1Y5S3W6_9PROT|nr:hypothetical protein [Oceanibacterium hippocampi]SLN30619.1 hypothetical protein OCH7691_01075 [Oceanibacterium hippocampi]